MKTHTQKKEDDSLSLNSINYVSSKSKTFLNKYFENN